MSVNALNTGSVANNNLGYVKGPPSDASAITAMRKAAVIVNYQYAATAGNTQLANGKQQIADHLHTRGFDGSGIMAIKAAGLSKNFLRTL
jgi:ABC-type Fe3+ transport system substrate-binding protein